MLDGRPNAQALNTLMIGKSTPEMPERVLKLELLTKQTATDGIATCEAADDYESRGIFSNIFEDTEEHIEWLETKRERIDEIGFNMTCRRRWTHVLAVTAKRPKKKVSRAFDCFFVYPDRR